jgi:PAS domain S-box-containing protein
MEQLAGRTLEEVVKHDWFDTFVPERDRPRTRWLFKQAIAGRNVRGNVYPILTRDRAERQIEWYESILERGVERADSLLCIGLDVTDRIDAEQERYAYEEKLRSLTAELISSEESERRELAAELHDQIGQTLALAKIKLGALREAAPVELSASVNELRDLVDQAVRSSRSLMMELGATVLHELGLEAALTSLVEEIQQRHGIACTLVDEGKPKPLPEQTKISLFRAVRELLMNVIKHGHAQHAEIVIQRQRSTIRIRVHDDGLGFTLPPEGFHASKQGGFGLFSIQERMAHLGGSLIVTSAPGAGTSVTLEAPLGIASDFESAP